MTDREKVIEGLTEIYDEAYDRWVHRPYIEDKLIALIRDNIPDALAMLREQSSDKDTNVLGKWISVKDRMPPNDDTKVMTYGNPVTHWMPLPEPPHEEAI